MKHIIFLFIFHLLLISCDGQEKKTAVIYAQKVEYGFQGPLKSVKLYGVKVEENAIPQDTLNYLIRVDYLFNKNGDLLTRNSLFKKEEFQIATKINYSGTGKNLKFKKEIDEKGKQKVIENYVLNWSDDYNYEIVKANNPDKDFTKVTLDKNFLLIKAVSKMDSTYVTETIETTFNKGKIEKVYSLSNMKYGTTDNSTSRIDVTQSYDQQGNPLKIFSYTDGKLETVYFKFYQYY